MNLDYYKLDRHRYKNKRDKALRFIKYFRKGQSCNNPLLRSIYKLILLHLKKRYCIEMSVKTRIGGGFYIGHPYGITINPHTVIGNNVNLHKGVTLGQENRGKRKGTPIIGNNVWIGVNATVVGRIRIGNDVLIAPNSFVNRDIPDHSIVIGNPCIVKYSENATEGYINFFD